MATNSARNTDDSTVGCFLESQVIKAIFTKIIKPVRGVWWSCLLRGYYQPSYAGVHSCKEAWDCLEGSPHQRRYKRLSIISHYRSSHKQSPDMSGQEIEESYVFILSKL